MSRSYKKLKGLTMKVAELISLGLAVPAMLLSAMVLLKWRIPTLQAYRTIASARTADQWIILGVFISFLGGLLDSMYWQLAWTAQYGDLCIKEFLMLNGALPNIFSRNLCDILAAWCHLMAYVRVFEGDRGIEQGSNLTYFTFLTFLLGAGYVVMLVIYK